ncbi:UDP-glucose 4-epimerase family protein [Stutzerimonas azotifigens]|uniref:SDR family oxidoreductase n=1 Tax=Stutzerimonas azotifigens TaxID=291995 RepID=A0ABR5Z4S4_9GAMM|nr:SDR family oxidoreductase [Stutzerimonas azotifigens]MBA1275225.1 SDR family oxidoreductase [Stutzerimonas azotifigens]
MRVLVTGASGFVGAALVTMLKRQGHDLVAATRGPVSVPVDGVEYHAVGDIGNAPDWQAVLPNIDVVVHAAARVHVMDERSQDPLQAFRRVNVVATLDLARRAAESGARRFIFISSVKVNGEFTLPDRPFRPDDEPAPLDPYGISKLEAEQGLLALSRQCAMDVVIIRPVLVYGPGVKANFRSMMNWLCRGIPLPLGAVANRRSLVALDNLTDLVATCLAHPAAADQIFLVSDGEDVSTPELLQRMAGVLGRRARLVAIPVGWMTAFARVLGRGAIVQRLCGSLQVDITKNETLLGWRPPVLMNQALARTAADYLEHRS